MINIEVTAIIVTEQAVLTIIDEASPMQILIRQGDIDTIDRVVPKVISIAEKCGISLRRSEVIATAHLVLPFPHLSYRRVSHSRLITAEVA